MTNFNDFSPQQQNILFLLDKHVDALNTQFSTIEQKAQNNITTTSVVLGVLVTLGFSKATMSQAASYLLILSFLLYLIMLFLCLIALYPRETPTQPLKPTWEEIQRVNIEYGGQDRLHAYYQWLAASYTDLLKASSTQLKTKATLVQIATYLAAANILFAILARLLSL